jgi:serine phosphatase RsbU (regulator of sigma subunit)/tetratricopeptide (TPR) repeat protein
MRIFCVVLIYFGILSVSFAQDTSLVAEMLQKKIKSTPQNREKVDLLNELAQAYEKNQPIEARTQAQDALVLAINIEYAEGEAQALKTIGNIYLLQSNYSQALEYFLNALKIFEELKQTKGIAETLNNVGNVYQNLGKFKEARQYYNQVIKIDEKNNDQKGLASSFNNIGALYYQQNNYDFALQYYQKSLLINETTQDEQGIALGLKNIGTVEYDQSRFGAARLNFLKSLMIDQSLNNQNGMAISLSKLANTHLKLSQTDSAKYYANQALDIAFMMDFKSIILEASSTLADVYAIEGDYAKAFENQFISTQIQADIFSEANRQKITDLQTGYELEKKQIELEKKQIELEESNRRRNTQLIYTLLTLGAGLIVMVFAIFLYRANRQKQAANQLLTQQNFAMNLQNKEIIKQRNAIEVQKNQIEKQSNEIAKKNSNIESSIQYAQRIQQAMLPTEESIDKGLPLHFILYLPRDVVSGDFYWFTRVEPRPIYEEETSKGKQNVLKGFTSEKIVIAAIDCTGHGVPGAFMSMIGDSLMNQIILDKGILEPDQILANMHIGIRTALKQSETLNQDGMDMSLCVIDKQAKTVEFAGAKNSLLYFQDKKLGEIKASIHGLGGWRDSRDDTHLYPKHTLSYAENPLTLYMYSDGYQDQFGGPRNKKFMRRRFKELLHNIYQEPMHYQKDILYQNLNEWMGDERQMDDILVIGVRLS